ncbi:MAG: hypothetical protein ACLQDV_00070 [Candidatus Binataceae bacterium]
MAAINPASLPKGLKHSHIERAVEYIEREANDLVELYHEQANVFSGIVGILGVKALDSFSPFKKHKHRDQAQQRFPDLSYSGKPNPPPQLALESKGSIRPWALQSHYDHSGWYIVWRYTVDPTQTIKSGTEVVIWRVDVVFLEREDWKYEGSKAGASGGGRTHTFAVRNPATKLANAAAYALETVVIKGGKAILADDAAKK